MATTDQDFSFPIFTDPFSCTIDSPPLWCLSPAASPDPYHEETSKESSTDGEDQSDQEDEEVFKDCFPSTEPIKYLAQRKSFSSIEELQGAAASKLLVMRRNGSRSDKEEKMDMLWEDFNTDQETLTRSDSSSRFDSGTVNMGCVEALRLSSSSKPNGTTTTAAAIFSPRKPGLVVFMKVLKSFFLLHNSHRSVKHHHHSSYRPSVKGHKSHKSVKIGSW